MLLEAEADLFEFLDYICANSEEFDVDVDFEFRTFVECWTPLLRSLGRGLSM